MKIRRTRVRAVAVFAGLALVVAACGGSDEADPAADDGAAEEPADDEPAADEPADDEPAVDEVDEDVTITVYSGRNEELVGEILNEFTDATGIGIEVRYGDTAELAATILEEGDASPADVYFGQDAGALGALEVAGRFVTLPDDLLDLVDDRFHAPSGAWTGITGRARVIAYNTEVLSADEVPDSVFDLADPAWQGRIGWAPENGSFQAFVTAMRVEFGDDTTREWLEGIIANDPVVFPNNTTTVEGVSRGEAEVGLVNHYYLARFTAEDPDFPVDNKYLPGDIGGLINVAGVGVLNTSDHQDAAVELVRYLLSVDVQGFFGQRTDALEFPLRDDVDSPELPTLESLGAPDVDLSQLEDLQGTLALLQEVGAFR